MNLSDAIKDLAQKVDVAVLTPGPPAPDEKAPKAAHEEHKARVEQGVNILKTQLAELKERQELEHKADTDLLAEIESKMGELAKPKDQAQAQTQAQTGAQTRKA
jgi:hypothetical protein